MSFIAKYLIFMRAFVWTEPLALFYTSKSYSHYPAKLGSQWEFLDLPWNFAPKGPSTKSHPRPQAQTLYYFANIVSAWCCRRLCPRHQDESLAPLRFAIQNCCAMQKMSQCATGPDWNHHILVSSEALRCHWGSLEALQDFPYCWLSVPGQDCTKQILSGWYPGKILYSHIALLQQCYETLPYFYHTTISLPLSCKGGWMRGWVTFSDQYLLGNSLSFLSRGQIVELYIRPRK